MDDNEGGNGKGRVLRMVWLAGFVLGEGGNLFNAVGGKDLPWWIVEVQSSSLLFSSTSLILFCLTTLPSLLSTHNIPHPSLTHA